MSSCPPLTASFRDPSGFLFTRAGALFRQINRSYRADYEHLMASGLHAELVRREWLVPHEEVAEPPADARDAWRVIRPERLPFISYPYEWCPEQLRDAALLTLKIQRLALRHGMSLKDASAYNVQFRGAQPVFIDTLSFERYRDGAWPAYRQFCQHFLAPLALMHVHDPRLGQLLRIHLDGVPLELASRLLPWTSWARLGLLLHVHLHARAQARYAGRTAAERSAKVAHAGGRLGARQLEAVVLQLGRTLRGLPQRKLCTEWGEYYADTNYTDDAMRTKVGLVRDYLDAVSPAPRLAMDLGANTGRFSRLAAERADTVIAWDIDPLAVQGNYLALRAEGRRDVLPLLQDLTNPSPALGWANAERASFLERGPADVVLALAVIHHLAITNNVPLPLLADFMAAGTRHLIIEFVPKEDSQVQRLLATRQDIFPDYTLAGFKRAFAARFELLRETPIAGSARTLFLLRRRDDA